jgi:Photosynthetic reaction centre cytochrome C subunit
MRRILVTAAIAGLLWMSWNAARSNLGGVGPEVAVAAPATTPAAPPAGMAPAPVAIDSFVAERDSIMNDVLQHIAGREQAPAESVFKNIKVMTGVPAGRLVRIMNMGFGRSLGVRCAHCHVSGHWDSEDKAQKQIARDMMAMTKTITTDLLPKIKNLHSEHPLVNCTTCHRGAIKPALNL